MRVTRRRNTSSSKTVDISSFFDLLYYPFYSSVRAMLYGFGDVENPLPETVAMVEDLAVQYIIDMVGTLMNLFLVSA